MRKINVNSHRRRGRISRSRLTSATLCIAAVAIALCAAFVRIRKDNNNLTDTTSSDITSSNVSSQVQSPVSSDSAQQANTTPKPSVPSLPQNLQNSSVTANTPIDEYEFFEDSEQTLAIQAATKPDNYVRAVGGAITKDFNMTGLVYSRTMGDWRVHSGVDISANNGEIVKSAAEGKVAGISHDPMYGTTVVVNQNDGLMVYYRGLNSDTAVSVGDNISAGTTLGTIGEIPCENGDGTHLHLEIMRDNKYLNPAEAFGYK